MSNSDSNRRIKFAYQMNGWSFENGDISTLKSSAKKIIPSEYNTEMDGSLFCPACFTSLNRVPKDKDYFTNGREAYFAHVVKYKKIKCDLKSIKPEGKKYNNWEEAKRAIDNNELVIVSEFMKNKPESKDDGKNVYDETPVEDVNGSITEVAIGRHHGETFALPSKIKTVAGLCRNFDDNLYKYFHLPGKNNAVRLINLLKNINTITEETNTPGFYYGKIISTFHLGSKRPENFRMTYFEKSSEVVDFCLKMHDKHQKDHGIDDNSIGKIIIIYGVVRGNGTGLCFQGLGWGEFSLLPEKYNYLLE